MDEAARFLLKVKKYFGVISTAAWLVCAMLLVLSVVAHAAGTFGKNVSGNIMKMIDAPAAGGLGGIVLLLFIAFYPHEDGLSIEKQLGIAARKTAKWVGGFLVAVLAIAMLFELLGEPLIALARFLYHDAFGIGKKISWVFSGVWFTLMAICLVLLVRTKSIALAVEVGVELVKETSREIIEFYVELFNVIRRWLFASS